MTDPWQQGFDHDALDVGSAPTVFGEFTNTAGQPADPTSVVFTARKPDGTLVSGITPTNPVVGTWQAILPLDQPGTWWWRFEGTGALVAVREGYLRVRRSHVLT